MGKEPAVMSSTFQMLVYIVGRKLILFEVPILQACKPKPGPTMKSRFWALHISMKASRKSCCLWERPRY